MIFRHSGQSKTTESPVGEADKASWLSHWRARTAEAPDEAIAQRYEPDQAVSGEAGEIESRCAALSSAIIRRKNALQHARFGFWMALSGAGLTLAPLLTGAFPFGSAGFWLPFGLIFGGEAIVVTSLLRGRKALVAAVGDLTTSDDPRVIGPLAEALSMGEPTYSHVVAALTRLLPALTPADRALVTDAQRACMRLAREKCLNRALFWRYNPHFAEVLRRGLAVLEDGHTGGEEIDAPPVTDVEALLAEFNAAVRQRNRSRLPIGAGAMVGAATGLATAIIQLTAYHHPSIPLLGSLAVGSIGLTIVLSVRGLFRLKWMMNELASAGDLRVVGPLIEIAAVPEGSADTMAALALTRLLPRLRASDAGLLTARQRSALGKALLNHTQNAEFLLAALKALEQMGDGEHLTVVEQLASGTVSTAAPARVQAAARECLPFLRARFDQQQARASLLRASDIRYASSAALLRPAAGVPARTAELLRPLDSRSDEALPGTR